VTPADDDGAQIEAIDASEAEELQEQAREALAADRAPVALGLIEQSLEQAPQSFDALSLKAKILVRLDRPAEALEAVDAALAIVPGDYDALAEKAGILSMRRCSPPSRRRNVPTATGPTFGRSKTSTTISITRRTVSGCSTTRPRFVRKRVRSGTNLPRASKTTEDD
jgi:tetratricopeptide (TPR) repeat protein